MSVLCVFVCVRVSMCVISNQSTSKKTYYVSELSKLDALVHNTHQGHVGTKLSRLGIIRSIISLSDITIQPKK